MEWLVPLPSGDTHRLHYTRPQMQAAHALTRDDARVVLSWKRGCGLSWFTRSSWYRLIAEYEHAGVSRPRPGGDPLRGARVIHVVPSVKGWRDAHARTAEQETASVWSALGGRYRRTSCRFDFPSGSWVQVMSPRDLLCACGARADMVTFDEADRLPANVLEDVAPALSEPWSLRRILVGGVWDSESKYNLLAAAMKWPGAEVIEATWRDCPEVVSPEYVEALRAQMSPEVFRREWEGPTSEAA